MKDKLTPQEKKRVSYEKDHRTHTGEDNRRMRRGWARRKKRVNRKYRRKTDAAIKKALKPERIDTVLAGDDATTRELIRKGLTRENNSRKWGVRSLREDVDAKLKSRTARRETNRQSEERLAQVYAQRITGLERDPDSKASRELLRALDRGEWCFGNFLRDHPEWRQRLVATLEILGKDEQKRVRQLKVKAEQKRKSSNPTIRL